VVGDLNARIGNKAVAEIVGDNGEPVVNHNGRNLIDFAAVHGLKITNSFFRHKDIHNDTWIARGYRSITDYVLTKRKASPFVQDIRLYRGYDINSNHFLLISKLSIPQSGKRVKHLLNQGKSFQNQSFGRS
jgi:hypothetical protein